MADIDLARLPSGELGWTAFVDHVASTDDRVERYFLEVKSDVDLTGRRGRAKVAKFILGAANRDPVEAARRLDGHAVMVLGVRQGAISGIPPFEAQDLARDVRKWVGADGPKWDFHRVPAADGQDVIVIDVDPPTGDVWTCRADGDGLVDGGIYVRADGNTRHATGDEIRVMLQRAANKQPDIDLDIEVLGEVAAVQVDEDILTAWVEQEADRLASQVDGSRKPTPSGGSAFAIAAQGLTAFERDRRSKKEYLEEVEEWRTRSLADPTAGVVDLLARVAPAIEVRVSNGPRTYLRAVRVEIEIGSDVRAVEWDGGEDTVTPNLFPAKPEEWGKSTVAAFSTYRGLSKAAVPVPVSQADPHGVIEIKQPTPCSLVMTLDDLRPEDIYTSVPNDVILLMFVDGEPAPEVSGRWRVTAADVHDVFTGEFTIPVRWLDWRGPIQSILRGEPLEPADEASDAE